MNSGESSGPSGGRWASWPADQRGRLAQKASKLSGVPLVAPPREFYADRGYGFAWTIAQVRAAGLTHVRLFLLWESFQPSPDRAARQGRQPQRGLCGSAQVT